MNENFTSSSPSSSSSSNASSPVTIRGDGLPSFGNNVASAVMRLPTDDELRYEGVEKLIQRLRICETEHKKCLLERSRVMKEVNRRLQVHLMEVRSLRDMNLKLRQEKDYLAQEKEELGGMCCFLDDDREKSKKMAHEWQVFGRYATGVLQKELSQCHTKIRDLEQRQQGFLLENRNLKELCLLLDQQQAGSRTSLDSQGSFHGPVPGLLGVTGMRDSGDGSSNDSATSNCSPDHRTLAPFLKENNIEGKGNYVHYLENRVHQLEDEVKDRLKKIPATLSTHSHGIPNMLPGKSDRYACHPAIHHQASSSPPISSILSPSFNRSSPIKTGNSEENPSKQCAGDDPTVLVNGHPAQSKPEPFLYALKVLDLHDQLDKSLPNSVCPSTLPPSNEGAHLGDQHKEIVREMCNVVWRKLGDRRGSNGHKPLSAQSRTLRHRSASVSNL